MANYGSPMFRGLPQSSPAPVAAPAPQPQTFNQKLAGLLGGQNPAWDMAMGLLAAGGPRPFPVSSGQALGQASQYMQQQQMMREKHMMDQWYKDALASRAISGSPESNRPFAKFEGANGNIWVIDANGKPIDTGTKFNQKIGTTYFMKGDVPYVRSTKEDGSVNERPMNDSELDIFSGASSRVAGDKRAATDQAAADVKASVEAPEKIKAAERAISDIDTVMFPALDRAIEQVSPWSAGYGSVLAPMPESDARALKATLDNIKSRLAVDTMMKMKAASATGSTGFGAMSERELAVTQDLFDTLDQGLEPSDLARRLQLIKENIDGWRKAYQEDIVLIKAGLRKPQGAAQPAPKTADDYLKAAGGQ